MRPLFVRTNLQDDEERADLLELRRFVDDALDGHTAGGREAVLIIVDAKLFPGAYQIAGGYTTKDGTTRARFKLRRDKQDVTDWIEVSGMAEALPALIVEAAQKHLPPDRR